MNGQRTAAGVPAAASAGIPAAVRRAARVALLALLTALVLIAAGCGEDEGETSGEAGSGGETVRVGVIVPLSGPFAASGESSLNGALAAAEFLNDGNSESGARFEVVESDDKGDPNRSAQAAVRLASEDTVALISLATPGAPLAVQPAVNRAELLYLGAISGMEEEIGPDGKYPWAFNTYTNPLEYAVKHVQYAKALGEAEVGEIWIDDPVGENFHNSAVAAAEQAGLKLVSESFSEQQRDLSAQLGDIRDSGVDTLMVWAYGSALVNVASSLAKIGWEPRVLTLLGATDPAVRELLEQSAPGVLAGMLSGPMASTYIAGEEGEPPPGKLAKAFAEYHTKVSGAGPREFSGVPGFDALIALDRGIAEAGSTDPGAIRDVFSTTPLEVSQGVTSWREARTGIVGNDQLGLFMTDSDLADGAGTAPPAP